ncbi:Malonyl CoA-acyl carrier protein transacylase [compost metagenome]
MMEASASGKGKMLAVSGMSIQTIEEMISRIENIKDRPVIACYNSSRQAVLSGTAESVAAAEELLQSEGARLSPLKVSGAFHSPLMAGAAEELEQLLQSCELGAFDFPVISNVEAKPYDLRGENIIRCLKRQMTEPVHWQQTMTALLKHSIDAAVEFAPRKTLAGLFRTDYPSVPVYSLEDHAERQTVFSLSFKREYAFSYRYALGQCLALAASVRNQCLDDQMYREQVIAPYRKIEHLLLQLEQSDAEPSDDQLRQAWDGLKTIIRAKGAPEDEYRNPLNVMERMLSRC